MRRAGRFVSGPRPSNSPGHAHITNQIGNIVDYVDLYFYVEAFRPVVAGPWRPRHPARSRSGRSRSTSEDSTRSAPSGDATPGCRFVACRSRNRRKGRNRWLNSPWNARRPARAGAGRQRACGRERHGAVGGLRDPCRGRPRSAMDDLVRGPRDHQRRQPDGHLRPGGGSGRAAWPAEPGGRPRPGPRFRMPARSQLTRRASAARRSRRG